MKHVVCIFLNNILNFLTIVQKNEVSVYSNPPLPLKIEKIGMKKCPGKLLLDHMQQEIFNELQVATWQHTWLYTIPLNRSHVINVITLVN